MEGAKANMKVISYIEQGVSGFVVVDGWNDEVTVGKTK